jgi:hypothetical protein
MAINIAEEKNLALTSKDRFDILSFAMDAAEDGGFVNSFIFKRAIFIYAAILLEKDKATEIRALATRNIINAWDNIVKDGTLEDLLDKYPREMEILSKEGETWFDEYESYVTSARGVLSVVEQFSGDIVGQAAGRLKTAMEESGAKNVIDLADEWGMNNRVAAPRKSGPYEEKDLESLFE